MQNDRETGGPAQAPDEESSRAPEASVEETLVRGRSPATPFVLLGSVAVVVWSAVAVLTLALLLVWWLV
jgi:hypothetical protein